MSLWQYHRCNGVVIINLNASFAWGIFRGGWGVGHRDLIVTAHERKREIGMADDKGEHTFYGQPNN